MTHKRIAPTGEQVIPDKQSLLNVERDCAGKSDAEKYRLAQADTLLRLARARNMEELERMAESAGNQS
jgi:hypothetical protein